MKTISKLLIANRGEIACRIIRTARSLGISTVAVYSDADAGALHVEMADEKVRIGPAPVSQSYLRVEAILEAAAKTGADAVHPGYGFLSENPDFVDALEAAGLTFVGPSAKAIRAMGLKDKAKALMEAAGVPVVPGYHGEEQNADFLAERADEIGYPVLIKARAGGGGKGMRLVEKASDFKEALASAQREGEASFGDGAVLVEKFIPSPRHIEFQVLGDGHGSAVHLFERDCSLQRRHQKVIEEAPAPGMTEPVRAAMGAAAVAAAKAVDYMGAGTVEFIVDGSGPLRPDGFWFMEMNTRLQVEHPVTEAVTGRDLVALQLNIAQGAPLPFAQEDLALNGHAFEARLYAEDATNDFLPAIGPLDTLSFPDGPRIDAGVRQGDEVTPHYDPMIAKIITHGPDRASALRKLERGLSQTRIAGCVTNRAFLQALCQDDAFAAGDVDTGLIARRGTALTDAPDITGADLALAALALALPEQPTAFAHFRSFGPAQRKVRFAGDLHVALDFYADGKVSASTSFGDVVFEAVHRSGDVFRISQAGVLKEAFVLTTPDTVLVQQGARELRFARYAPSAVLSANGADRVAAPMPGRVSLVSAQAGDKVAEGDTLLVLEAMKMEHRMCAPRSGVIAEITVAADDQVAKGDVLVRLKPQESA